MQQQRTVLVRARGVSALEGATLIASLLVSCLPRQDLSSYSSGRDSSESQSAPPDGVAADDAGAVLGESVSSSALAQGGSGSAATRAGCGAECLPMDLGLDADAGAFASGSPGGTSSDGAMDAGSSARCAPDATPGPDERCFTLVTTLSSWQEARSGCQSRGAGWDLVTIQSTQRNAWLSALLGSVADAWVGA
ncbi:MAG TPA: C-type lectin domain-containing protein, partial [Polyangiaceae bacterium]|nr:C-type lectin domain-containing protein [Polyangiaceae bacterium]